ncbi:MAG: ParA family protein [Neisseriaceae bacterium]|nr:ParA family protein [Neisseriaceae bacterium]
MKKILIWNNKGGTGKTTLSFQLICEYAINNPQSKILAIDVCPQANLSELFLGGLSQGGSTNLLQIQGRMPRSTIAGYFQLRLPSPYSIPNFNATDFITTPNSYNNNIPPNIDLVCGDPLLELQSTAISTLANTQIPGTNTWLSVVSWINDFVEQIRDKYDFIIFDANPSFSMYTQIAVAGSDFLVLPVMADDSSRRAIQNAFSLVYGLKLPSEIYAKYAFAEKLKEANKPLPKVRRIVKNRLTQYMGAASAYHTVLTAIDDDVEKLLQSNPDIFDFTNVVEGMKEVRDFQTTGVVSAARGCPFQKLRAGTLDLLGRRVQVKEEYRQNCIRNINELAQAVFL